MARHCVRWFLTFIIIAGVGVVSKPFVEESSGFGIEGKKMSESLSKVDENFGISTKLFDKKFHTVDKNETVNEEEEEDKEKNPLGSLSWILSPFINKIEFSRETLIEERIEQIKETIANLLGSIFPNQENDPGSKQLPVNIKGIGNLLGLNGSSRFDNKKKIYPDAGFFGGNGWFANKGGILGGPGAFISTGSLFTDYQTPYKK